MNVQEIKKTPRPRYCGILVHPTSFPSPYGIGDLGDGAYAFIDFLYDAGQTLWQCLPLGPTGFGDSPYQAFSAFAGQPLLISPDLLLKDGLLEKDDLADVPDFNDYSVEYGNVITYKAALLRKACAHFTASEDKALHKAFNHFCRTEKDWLEDYALFTALKDTLGGKPWLDWPEALRLRKADALTEKRRELSEEIRLQFFAQYEFDKQWKALRSYANAKGVRIIGDVPIYVPLDSADVWANPELFQLDERRHPEQVAGCPPDSFTADGQLWGNPIYDWKKMAQTRYSWWIQRLAAAGKLYDVIRLDHFRGFESYWSVPAGDTTARNGKWVKGPGMDFVRTIQQALPDLEFIAEDLGFITPEVRKLQQDSGYPGMKVLEFAFDSREESDYMPHLYPVDSVCYTGTHDNVTLKQWFDEAAPEDVACAKAYLGLNREEGYIRGMIRGCMGSMSQLCVVQMQDYLELGKEARMNFPGTLSSANWTWRAEKGFDSDTLAARIYAATKLYGRVGK